MTENGGRIWRGKGKVGTSALIRTKEQGEGRKKKKEPDKESENFNSVDRMSRS